MKELAKTSTNVTRSIRVKIKNIHTKTDRVKEAIHTLSTILSEVERINGSVSKVIEETSHTSQSVQTTVNEALTVSTAVNEMTASAAGVSEKVKHSYQEIMRVFDRKAETPASV